MEQLQAAILKALQTNGMNASQFARHSQLDKDLIHRILNDKISTLPSFESIDKLANALAVPPWQIMEWLGIRLGLPKEAADRTHQLESLAQTQPQLRRLIDRLLVIAPSHPDYVHAALGYLEFAIAQHESAQPSDQLDDSDQ